MNHQLIMSSCFSAGITGRKVVDNVIFTIVGIAVLAVLSRVVIPLPFTPVPLTGQTFGILLIGLLYGRKRGLAVVTGYLGAGSIGLPVFAAGHTGFFLLSPAGGYLTGFILAVAICGYFAEKGYTKSFVKTLGVMLLAECAIYMVALTHLSFFVSGSVIKAGLLPFIPGDIIKMFAVPSVLKLSWKFKKDI